MALQTLNLSDVQGSRFDIDEDGVRLLFGTALRRLTLKNRDGEGAYTTYFSLGSAGLLNSALSTSSSLASLFPFLEAGESFTLEHGVIQPTEVQLKTASGTNTTDFRVEMI